ncbi:hypothetical protein ACE1SV_57100 [Streptomyces sennicomposti]
MIRAPGTGFHFFAAVAVFVLAAVLTLPPGAPQPGAWRSRPPDEGPDPDAVSGSGPDVFRGTHRDVTDSDGPMTSGTLESCSAPTPADEPEHHVLRSRPQCANL